ncbi:MAG: CCA tRNA nucleotidyltransferase [Chloroflexota bacterium]|nr:CCA tRNA nucleotidyltransferase [Chloroflexota bacterium]
MVSIAKDIEAQLPQELLLLIESCAELAARAEQRLYLVGGAVRDLFLKRPVLDIDLVVEGNAPELALQLVEIRGGDVIIHPRFGTATVRQGTMSIDLVSARSETYAMPGALPTVTPGTIEDDLFRRDFTIHAMAVRLDHPHFGDLVDPHGGYRDLSRGLIKVLHSESFRDDPTRIWRALRYEQRLGFSMEASTEQLLRRDAGMVDRVSGDRLRHELERILEENSPEKVFCRAEELGALRYLHQALKANGLLVEYFEQARRASADLKPEFSIYLALLVWRLDEEQLEGFLTRLRFNGEIARVLRDTPHLKREIRALEKDELLPSDIYHLLEYYNPQAIFAAALTTDNDRVRARIELYLSELQYVSPALNGDDLKRMGVIPGENMGKVLQALKDARLNDKVKSRECEQDLVRQWLIEGNTEEITMERKCSVCGKPLTDEKTSASCALCGAEFHLDVNGPAGSDCGGLLSPKGRCGLAFVCQPCYDKTMGQDSKF